MADKNPHLYMQFYQNFSLNIDAIIMSHVQVLKEGVRVVYLSIAGWDMGVYLLSFNKVPKPANLVHQMFDKNIYHRK